MGLLLPGINGEPGTGVSVAAIASQRWSWITVHLNVTGTLTRQQHGGLFVGTIVEGPSHGPSDRSVRYSRSVNRGSNDHIRADWRDLGLRDGIAWI